MHQSEIEAFTSDAAPPRRDARLPGRRATPESAPGTRALALLLAFGLPMAAACGGGEEARRAGLAPEAAADSISIDAALKAQYLVG